MIKNKHNKKKGLTLAEIDELSMKPNKTDGYEELSQKGPTQEEIIAYNREQSIWDEACRQTGGEFNSWYEGLSLIDKNIYHTRLVNNNNTKRDHMDSYTGIQTDKGTKIGTYRDKQRTQNIPKNKVNPTDIWVSIVCASLVGLIIGLTIGRLL